MQANTKMGVVVLAAIVAGLASWTVVRPPLEASASGRSGKNAGVHSSSNAAPVVVELFTSEGCSSCPPADDLLRRVANSTSEDGQTIIALSEHVTYWNRLGWADPFSNELFSSRQDGYAAALGTSEVYTPQAVVNGRVQFVGSDAAAMSRALHSQLSKPGAALAVTGLQRSGGNAVLEVRSGPTPAGQSLELWAAVTDDRDTSSVSRGENEGRTLQHVAVVRSLVRVGSLRGAGEQSVVVPLPEAVLRDSTSGHHITVLAQMPGQGAILGAAVAAL